MTKVLLLLCFIGLFQLYQTAPTFRGENRRFMQMERDCTISFSPRKIPSGLPSFVETAELNSRQVKVMIPDLSKVANPADAKNNADNNLSDIKFGSDGIGCLGAIVKIYTGANFMGASYTFSLSEPEGTLKLSKYLKEHASSIKFFY